MNIGNDRVIKDNSGKPVIFPKDGNYMPTAVVSGYDSNGNPVLAQFTTDGSLVVANDKGLEDFFQQTTFITTGNGNLISSTRTLKNFAIQVSGIDSTPNNWEVVLEGSLDGLNFDTILVHDKNSVGNGKIMFNGNQMFPVRKIRARVISLDLGSATSIKVSILGVA